MRLGLGAGRARETGHHRVQEQAAADSGTGLEEGTTRGQGAIAAPCRLSGHVGENAHGILASAVLNPAAFLMAARMRG